MIPWSRSKLQIQELWHDVWWPFQVRTRPESCWNHATQRCEDWGCQSKLGYVIRNHCKQIQSRRVHFFLVQPYPTKNHTVVFQGRQFFEGWKIKNRRFHRERLEYMVCYVYIQVYIYIQYNMYVHIHTYITVRINILCIYIYMYINNIIHTHTLIFTGLSEIGLRPNHVVYHKFSH